VRDLSLCAKHLLVAATMQNPSRRQRTFETSRGLGLKMDARKGRSRPGGPGQFKPARPSSSLA
jgi:hypothetical protein